MTDYIILRADPDRPRSITDGNPQMAAWEELKGIFKASSARRALAAANVTEGEYVAVPLRSWNPLTVTVEQTTKVTIS